jgi:DNA-binding CsgD family transcriptional regulator/tetratricopeptide (TPR) repeat protein
MTSGSTGVPSSPPSGDGLVGRGREQASIADFVEGVATGAGPGVLVVQGAAGIGKSSLLRAAASLAEARGVRVLRASGAEFEASVAFSTIQQLLLPVLADPDQPAGLLPEHRDALYTALGLEDGPEQNSAAITAAARALVGALTASAPLLLVVDDLHWVDAGSAALLTDLGAALPPRAGLLGGTRPGEDAPLPPGSTVITVGGLDPEDAAAVLREAAPDAVPAVRARLVDEAAGNPLALVELPAGLDAAQRRGTRPLPQRLPLNHRLQQTFDARIGGLTTPTRQLLLLAALEPGLPATDLLDLPDEHGQLAGAGGVAALDPVTGRVRFRHPLMTSALVAAATPEERTSAHRRLGRLLADRGDLDPERSAWHLAEAADGPHDGVASSLESAAAVARRRGDWRAAAAALERAAELSADADERLRRLSEAAYLAAGTDHGQARRIVATIGASDPGFERSLATALAAATVMANGDEGDIDRAHELLVDALDRYAGTDPDDHVLLEAIDRLRWICWLGGRPELWPAYYRAVARLSPPAPLIDLASRTAVDPARTTDASLTALDSAIAGLETSDDPEHIVAVAEMAYIYDRVPACRPALDRVIAAARDGGATQLAVFALLIIGLDAFHRGRWDATPAAIHEARELAGGLNVQGWAVDYEFGLLAAARGDAAAATGIADGMARWALPRRAETVLRYAHHVETLSAAGRSEHERAYQYATAISPAGELARHAWLALAVALDLVESAMRTGRPDMARAHVAALDAADIGRLSPRLRLVHLACRALAAEPGDATELYQRALAVPGADDWWFDRARVQLLLGSHLRRQQAVTAARVPLRAALARFEELGAHPWAARTRSELEATAEVRARTSGADSPVALTSQERRIAELAARGLTNKRIAERLAISPRTVGNHLYQVYAKLGVGSRGGLRDSLDREQQ